MVDQQKLRQAFPADWAASKLTLPVPKLDLDFRISVALNPVIAVGDGPWGKRNWISFAGGQWSASWGHGTVEPGGQDSQLVHPDTLHTYVSANYLLKTADAEPAYITVQTTGWRTGPKDVLEKLFDPEQANNVKANEYSFRLNIKLETGDERYKDGLNSGVWVGSGVRRGTEGEYRLYGYSMLRMIYDAYRVL